MIEKLHLEKLQGRYSSWEGEHTAPVVKEHFHAINDLMIVLECDVKHQT